MAIESLANLLKLQSKLAADRSREKIQTGRATSERFTPSAGQLANFSGMLAPGAGIADAAGLYSSMGPYEQPYTEAFSNEPYPSMAENIEAGRYLDAGLQSLGVAGDAIYAAPFVGPTLGTGIKGIGALGLIARAKPQIVGAPSKKALAQELATTPVIKTEGKKITSKQKRARDLGFRIDEPVYHGTHSKDLNRFDDSFIGNRDEGFFGRGHYFTRESGEAKYYGPNVGEYYTRGKLLDLSQTKQNSNYELMDKDYFKFWTKELDKIDMLDEPTKKGLKTINKIDDYVEKNVKVTKGQNSNGTTGFAASVKHPTREPYVFEDAKGVKRSIDETLDSLTFNRSDGVEFHATKEKAIKSLKNRIIYEAETFSELKKVFPDLNNTLFSLSDYIRVGGKGAAELTEKAKKAGYDGIKAGDETVIFDPKNIRSTDADFNPKNIESDDLLSSREMPDESKGISALLSSNQKLA